MRLLKPYFMTCLLLSACGGNADDDISTTTGSGLTSEVEGKPVVESKPVVEGEPVVEGDWYRPAPHVTWQWQLQGEVNTDYAVEIYGIDLFDSSTALIGQLQAAGKKVICYFSAGSHEEWRPDTDRFAAADLGDKLDDWAGERWLDIRSNQVRKIMIYRLDLAARKGCDGVEPDNMDGYTNTPGFNLSAEDQLAYSRFIANEAHHRNLAVGLKNDLDQIPALVDYFDFAINEQCFQYNECAALAPFTESGKPVLHIEYLPRYANDPGARAALCSESINLHFSTLILPLALDDGYRYDCR